jgi:hypothetical protein
MPLHSQPDKRRLMSALGSDARRYLNGGGLYDTYLMWKLLFIDGYERALWSSTSQYSVLGPILRLRVACDYKLLNPRFYTQKTWTSLNFECSKIVQSVYFCLNLFWKEKCTISWIEFWELCCLLRSYSVTCGIRFWPVHSIWSHHQRDILWCRDPPLRESTLDRFHIGIVPDTVVDPIVSCYYQVIVTRPD